MILDGAPESERPVVGGLTCAVPAIVVSAGQHVEHEATAVGARAWLRKPYDIDELLDLVREHTRPHRERES